MFDHSKWSFGECEREREAVPALVWKRLHKLGRSGKSVDGLWFYLTPWLTSWKISEGVTVPPAVIIGHFHASVVRLLFLSDHFSIPFGSFSISHRHVVYMRTRGLTLGA